MLITLLHICAALVVTVHVAIQKRNIRSAVGWIGLAWFAPIAGPALYLIFGINKIRRIVVTKGMEKRNAHLEREGVIPRTEDKEIPHSGFSGMNRLAQRVSGRPLSSGNRIELLVNGDEAYPAMLKAIQEANRSISLCSYIFDNDEVGREFLKALKDAEARRVEVRVLIDALGSRYSLRNMVELLKREGIQAEAFLSTRSRGIFRYANLRNHRKIMVVDGELGFTGGMNIRQGHMTGRNPSYPIKCLHFKVLGPVVTDLQRAFVIDWAFTTGEILSGTRWFFPMEKAGNVHARGIPDGPDSDLDNMRNVMLGALAASQFTIKIVTPYFFPDEALTAALKIAALRGVEVDIVLPGRSNLPLIDWAMTPQLTDLLKDGCRIHLSPPPFDHAKIFVVDGFWSLIGSTNWDPRSLRLNFEYNLECYDSDLAAALEMEVEQRIRISRCLTLEELENSPFLIRLRDGLTRLLTPYL